MTIVDPWATYDSGLSGRIKARRVPPTDTLFDAPRGIHCNTSGTVTGWLIGEDLNEPAKDTAVLAGMEYGLCFVKISAGADLIHLID